MEKFTNSELRKISHSLGIDLYSMAMSHLNKDKKLPEEFYRNYYQIDSEGVLDALVTKGYATKRNVMDQGVYHISDLGILKFRREVNSMMKYVPKQKRDLAYMKQRINWYTDWQGYNFCDDNSEHIMSAYVNYYLEGHYMSHTTTDCVNMFRSELKRNGKHFIAKIKAESVHH